MEKVVNSNLIINDSFSLLNRTGLLSGKGSASKYSLIELTAAID